MNKLQMKKESLNPANKRELNRFELTEYCLYGFMQLLLDKGIINHKELQQYTVKGILNGKESKTIKPEIKSHTEDFEVINKESLKAIEEELNKPLTKFEKMKLKRQKKGG
jgi:hypothetical protein